MSVVSRVSVYGNDRLFLIDSCSVLLEILPPTFIQGVNYIEIILSLSCVDKNDFILHDHEKQAEG